MTDKPTNLAAALAQLQTMLPDVGKGNTAEVQGETKAGKPFKYKYRYADLADVSKAILPLLGKLGLSWVTKPTFNDGGKFVLVYKLKHVSGDEETGEYPLQLGTPQEMGSAITYARRYALCSVTGVAPESDDDDGAHASQRRESWDDAKPGPPRPPEMRANVMRNAINAITDAPDRAALEAIEERIVQAVEKQFITEQDAVELRRLKVQRLDVVYQSAHSSVPVDQRQHRRMHALWREVGLGGTEHRETRLTRTSLIVGRDIDSSAELTAAEADRVIEALEAERKRAQEPPQAEQTPEEQK